MAHILLVEDDEASAIVTSLNLKRRAGYEVTVTRDPAEVLEACENREVDLVLMDVSLHGAKLEGKPIDGTGISRRLKENPKTSSIPIILITAHAMRSDQERLLNESQADAYVAKPISDHAKLIALIEEHLSQRAQR